MVLRIHPVYVAHRSRKISPWSTYQQMIMIAHQTIRMTFQCETSMRLFQTAQNSYVVLLAVKNILSAATAAHHVVVRALVFYSQWSRHVHTILLYIVYLKTCPLLASYFLQPNYLRLPLSQIQSYIYTLQHVLEYGKCGICKT